MNVFSKQNKYLFVFTCSVSILLITRFIKSIIVGYEKESWQVTEFLINYQGGFVRRGLLGEIIFNLHKNFNVSPYKIILIASIIFFTLLVIFFVVTFIKKGYPLFLLVFSFFLGGPIMSDFWFRKDALIILLFICALFVIQKKVSISFVVTNLVLIFGLLVHESIAFISFPILLLLNYNANKIIFGESRMKSALFSLLLFVPTIFVFYLTIHFKGSIQVATEIWNSWKPINFPHNSDYSDALPAAIDGLSWTLNEGLLFTKKYVFDYSDYGIHAAFAWLITIVIIYFVLINTDKLKSNISIKQEMFSFSRINFSALLLFQLVAISPLFLLGCDYGRWVFFWVCSSFSIYLIIPENTLNSILPTTFKSIAYKINTFLFSIFGNSKGVVFALCLFIGVPGWSWTVESYLYTNPLFILLQTVSKFTELPFTN